MAAAGEGLRLGLHPAHVPTSPSLSPSFIKQEAGGSEHAHDSGTQWQAGSLALHPCCVSWGDAVCEVGLCCTKDVVSQERSSEA